MRLLRVQLLFLVAGEQTTKGHVGFEQRTTQYDFEHATRHATRPKSLRFYHRRGLNPAKIVGVPSPRSSICGEKESFGSKTVLVQEVFTCLEQKRSVSYQAISKVPVTGVWTSHELGSQTCGLTTFCMKRGRLAWSVHQALSDDQGHHKTGIARSI